MTTADRPTFVRALALLAETLGQSLSDARAEGYYAALGDLELPEVLAAIGEALRHERYPVLPTPGALRAYLGTIELDAAGLAWEQFVDALRRIGYYGEPVLTADVLTVCTQLYGSWQNACATVPASQERKFEDHRRRFVDAYRGRTMRSPGIGRLDTGASLMPREDTSA